MNQAQGDPSGMALRFFIFQVIQSFTPVEKEHTLRILNQKKKG